MGRFLRYKMFIIYKVGKYDQKIIGIFILLKKYVKSCGGRGHPLNCPPLFSSVMFPLGPGVKQSKITQEKFFTGYFPFMLRYHW